MAAGGAAGNLPAKLASFVGRRGEAAEVKRLLSGCRLVMLTGVGGVGKTWLALRVASDLRRAFRQARLHLKSQGCRLGRWLTTGR